MIIKKTESKKGIMDYLKTESKKGIFDYLRICCRVKIVSGDRCQVVHDIRGLPTIAYYLS